MNNITKAALFSAIWLYFFALAVIYASLPGIAATIAVLAAAIYADEVRDKAKKKTERDIIKADFRAEMRHMEEEEYDRK